MPRCMLILAVSLGLGFKEITIECVGKGKGITAPGIYKPNGDELVLCFSGDCVKRPLAFHPRNGQLLYVFKRKKP